MRADKVFISHTSDMAEFPARRSFVQAALDAVIRAGMTPVDMRYFAARGARPADYCRERVRDCEIYVAVIGFRYGSIVPGEAVSYTELEFNEAGASGRPRLVFLLDRGASLRAGMADADSQAVEGFRQRVRDAGLITASFVESAGLELEVFHALAAVGARPRSHGSLPRVWNVPPRNPNFTGRAAELNRIRGWLDGGAAVTVHALRGMGGVGKTQTVIEYAYRHADDYDLAWWIRAEQPTVIGDDLAALADELGLPLLRDPQLTARAVCRELRGRDRWLLVFDNAEDPAVIGPLLPGGPGHVLITTRRNGFGALGGILDLDTMDRQDAVSLLRRRVPDLAEDLAWQLAAALGNLPLAVDQAAAYLDQTGMPAQDYIGLLRTRGSDLYGRGRPSGHPGTVATVWSVSMDHIQAAHPAAAHLLDLCAWLGPEPIPLDLFTSHPGLLPDPLADAAADPIAFNDTIGVLADFSLARPAASAITVHRLVQDVTRHRASSRPSADPGEPLEVALSLLHADLPGRVWSNTEAWPRWRVLLPAVLSATSHDASPDTGDAVAWLLSCAGTYLRSEGRYAEALALLERALRIHQALTARITPT